MSTPTPVRAGEDAGREAARQAARNWLHVYGLDTSEWEGGAYSKLDTLTREFESFGRHAKSAAEARASAAEAEAEVARLRERLEIVHAYDGEGKQIPFPAGMEHLDGIACRDETIKGLDALVSALRERVARLEETLRPFADICDAEHMRWVKDEQVLELSTRAEVPVSEKLRGRDFRRARAALTEGAPTDV